MEEHLSDDRLGKPPGKIDALKDRISHLAAEAPRRVGQLKEKLPLHVAETTARAIWKTVKREKEVQTPHTEQTRELSKWEKAALELAYPPLPNLHTTEQMLRSASGLVQTEARAAWTNISLLIHELGFARRQQKAVEKIIAANQAAIEAGKIGEIRNPTTEGFEAYMAGNDEPLPFSTNHAEVLVDDEHKTNDVDRTAALICGVRQVRDEVRDEVWDVEKSRNKKMDMRGYKRAFSKRDAGEKGDTLISVLNSDHVTVIIDGVMFNLPLSHEDGTELTPDEIRANIQSMKDTVEEPSPVGPGILTTMRRRDWWHTRQLLKSDSSNAQTLESINNSLWTFVIDTEARPDTREQTASLMQYGTFKVDNVEVSEEGHLPYNTFGVNEGYQYVSPGGWYDGHSMRIAANGKAGCNFEHLAIDGSESMWMLDKIGEAAKNVSFSEQKAASSPLYEPLPLIVQESVLNGAYEGYIAEIKNQELGVFEVPMAVTSMNYYDSTIQIALAAAQYEANGNKPSFAIEPMNLRHQIGGRLGYGLLNLHAVQKYIEWMVQNPDAYAVPNPQRDPVSRSMATQLCSDARTSHLGMLNEVKDGNAPLNHMTTLTGIFKDELTEKGEYTRDLEAFFTSLDPGLYNMVRGNVMTNGGSRNNVDAFMTIASMSVDGIAIGYSKKKDSIVFTMRAKGKSKQNIDIIKKTVPKYLTYVMRDQLPVFDL